MRFFLHLALSFLAVTILSSALANPAYQCVASASPVRLDGSCLQRFDGLPVIALRDRTQLAGADSWKGVDDLSATLRVLFDDHCLYVLVEVMDNDRQWPTAAGGMYDADSIQLAFDPNLDGGDGYSPDDSEYTISFLNGKPAVWRDKAPGDKATGLVASVGVFISPNHPAYPGWYAILAFPWSEIGLAKAQAGSVFGMNILVNDRDAGRDRIFMQWTPGIGKTKVPAAFGRMQLVAQANNRLQAGEIDDRHPENWAEKWIKVNKEMPLSADSSVARGKGGVYCWWVLDGKLPLGSYRIYARLKGKGTFSLQASDLDSTATRSIPPVVVNTANYVLYDLGLFEYSRPYRLRLSDWSTTGLSVDYLALKGESGMTTALAAAKAAAICRQAAALDQELLIAEKAGLDVLDQRITCNVATLFAGYGQEDVAHGKLKRGEKVLAFLETALARASTELKTTVAAGGPMAPVPPDLSNLRWTRGHFYSGERPVFLYGVLCATPEITKKVGLNCRYLFVPLSDLVKDDSYKVDPAALSATTKEIEDSWAAGLPMIYQLATHYFPGSILSKYPETRLVGESVSFINHCMESPVSQKVYAAFFEQALPAMAERKLLGLELANELGYACKCGRSLAEFRTYLATEYGSVEKLSSTWGRPFASFEAVPFPDKHATGAPKYDWCDFNQRRTLTLFAKLNEQAHQAAPKLATSIKVVAGRGLMSDGDVSWGIDHEKMAQLCSWTGEDSYFSESGELRALMYDWYRSLSGGRPVVDTECPFIRLGATAAFVRFNTWIGAVHGEAGAMHFVWDRNESERPANEDLIATQPWAVEALGRTAQEINRVSAALVDLSTAPSAFRILYSRSSSIVSPEHHLPELVECYRALMFTGIPVGFVTERQLAGGNLAGVEAILLPCVDNLPEDALHGLATFAQNGGTLIFCGTSALKTERDVRRTAKALDGLAVNPGEQRPYGKGRLIGIARSESRDGSVTEFGTLVDSLPMDRCPGARLNLEARRVRTGDAEIRVYLNYGESALAVSTPQGAFDLLRQQAIAGRLDIPALGVALIRVPVQPGTN